ncbi:hypothetical protein Bhyg_13872 [Pseudolycoriella hygida]|uniref:Hemolymph juvenile hormone binding protein n=1 Tax=Pseudolycoriella hygida TaxID=35572 RepID=A0A9Q0MS44_9DIPT|nr:hypothetical protein Bhyg_13872 [Pseudolycoriella hygida]
MKFLVVICILIFISIDTASSLPKPINKILREKIEKIRSQMPCGIGGGPSLAPFHEEFVDVSYEESSTFRIAGFLETVRVDNLNEFVVDNIDFSLLRLKLDFGFTLPNTVLTGRYNITAEYLNRIKLWGDGAFSIKLNDLQLAGSLSLRILNGHLDMTKLQTVLSLNSINSDISGILGSEQTSLFFNTMIENSLPQLLDDYSDDISELMIEYVTPIANEYLHKLTLSDIIGGGNGNDEPCVAKYLI